LITGAVEEALRVDTPVTYMGRTVTEDTELGGVAMHKGEKVMLLWAAANFDESVFEDPEEFSIERQNNRHLAFGSGIHRCQGAAMGRLEMRVVLEEILGAIPDYVVVESGVSVRNYAGVHSVKSLPVTFTPK
jgi:cytochrome P450